ncbi:zinc-dependent peptidase [Winogradskyella tangerina]|uniref:zinc-dependent peptidase n=1 Tax=Winogradskyella tangerina TaxID=2023240 RepID=UPI000DBE573E|nr:zinc-dependent peptidase [Winogradskyella tangerina]
MMNLPETQLPEIDPTLYMEFPYILMVALALFVLARIMIYVEQLYAYMYRKPFFLNFPLSNRKISINQSSILRKEFSFYNKLSLKDKEIFHHRLATFIESKNFIGRDGQDVSEKMATLISATAVMLTFGFRKYKLELFDKIIIYPEAYYSRLNDAYHQGETNPQHGAIVFSWEDFKKGYHVGDDNLNLGIHEFGHAIHLNAFSNDDISSEIFKRGFKEIISYLENNPDVRQELISSKYFRAYAYTNHYEFFAVILENFIETPTEFRSRFPELYKYVRQMLNFRFAGY